MQRPFNILFLGSDNFSVDVFKAIYQKKPRTGRRLKELKIPPLLALSNELQLRSFTPRDVELADIYTYLDTRPDVILTASYGHLLPSSLLNLVPPKQAINVHPSLLPKLRGAAPIQWSIARQLHETGVSIQTMQDDVFDSGDILYQKSYKITDKPTYNSLSKDLGQIAAECATNVLENLNYYIHNSRKQDPSEITHAPKVHRKIGFVDFNKMPASVVDSRYRAFGHQRPLSGNLLQSNTLHQFHDIEPYPGIIEILEDVQPGSATLLGDKLIIKCADMSYLQVKSLKPPGKRIMSAHEWWNGHKHDLKVVNFTKPLL
ncbi:Formyltransferase [Wallemia mellicola]|nr:Formyltransferase [Wallemia mellicola]TIB91415.1 Formyltransferase [Wallemia mellicola]TIC42826.1 Formyltransferase [Wallemia mellicola]TIC51648.1 Formyltransferase [Wallemia mellicola]TIC56360.1 Formyltransferase [Wallemia mellicola]